MSRKQNRPIVRIGRPAGCLPFVLFILCFLIPVLAGKFLLLKAVEFDRRLNLASAKQNLINQKQEYSNSLKNEYFLKSQLSNKNLSSLYERNFDLKEISENGRIVASAGINLENLKRNKIIRNLPWGETDLKAGIHEFIDFLETQIGLKPALAFALVGKSNSRIVLRKPPFNHIYSRQKVLAILDQAACEWLDTSLKNNNKKIHFQKNKLSEFFENWFKSFYSLRNKTYALETFYTFRAKDVLYRFALSFADKENRPVNLNLFYLRKDFDWRFMLKQILRQKSRGFYKHSFGYSKSGDLPYFYEDADNLNFIFKIPAKFSGIYKIDADLSPQQTPVIKISYPLSKIKPGFLGKKEIDFIIYLILILGYLAIIAFYCGRFKNKLNLKVIVTLAILLGTFVPFAGLTWVGVSYLNGRQQHQALRVKSFLEQKVDQFEKTMNLDRIRTETLYHIMAHRIEKIRPEKRRLLADKINYYSLQLKEKYPADFIEPFVGYFLFNNDGKDITHMRNSFKKSFRQTKPFFKGTFNSLMLDMGVYNHLSMAEKNAIIQQIQLADGVTEKAVDKQMFYNMLEYEGSGIKSRLMPSKQYLYSFVLNQRAGQSDGVLNFILKDSCWVHRFTRKINQKIIPLSFKNNGFDIDFSFYSLDHVSLKSLDMLSIKNSVISYDKQEKFYNLAQALFANSNKVFINNISQKPSHLIYAELIAGRNIFALAYAEKKQSQSLPLYILLAIAAIVCLVVSLICLAFSTAQILLMSIPAFYNAIEMVDYQNFNWEIQINSGDEFEELADSFNKMGRKLYQKEQMSELVSENVLQAVKGETRLQTGGEKLFGTVLFSDLRGFTTLSEKFSAEEIVEMLNEYFTLVNSIIEKRGGVIDKLIGDAVQAVFYRQQNEEPCELRAVKAAREIQLRLKQFNRARAKNNKFEIANGFGIATGTIISGRVGTETGKLDATILGQVVYRAEKLEAFSKNTKLTGIMLDEATVIGLKKENNSVKLKEYDVETARAFELIELK